MKHIHYFVMASLMSLLSICVAGGFEGEEKIAHRKKPLLHVDISQENSNLTPKNCSLMTSPRSPGSKSLCPNGLSFLESEFFKEISPLSPSPTCFFNAGVTLFDKSGKNPVSFGHKVVVKLPDPEKPMLEQISDYFYRKEMLPTLLLNKLKSDHSLRNAKVVFLELNVHGYGENLNQMKTFKGRELKKLTYNAFSREVGNPNWCVRDILFQGRLMSPQ